MRTLTEPGATLAEVIAAHVALTGPPRERAFVRCNMITSADGGSGVDGVSGGLGDSADKAVFAALRARADTVLVGMSTAVAEHYHPPASDGPSMFVVASRPDISGDPELFASGRVTLVLPDDAGPAPAGVAEMRAGTGGRVDLGVVCARLAGRVVMLEGGPRLAGLMASLGLIDELFVTVAPRVIGGDSTRILHGPDADPSPWDLRHGFVDEQGFLFLRYARPLREETTP